MADPVTSFLAKLAIREGIRRIHQRIPGGWPTLAGVVLLLVVALIASTSLAVVTVVGGVGLSLSTAAFCGHVMTPVARDTVADIPPVALDAYRRAGQATGIDWVYLAAIGKIESDHGRYRGSQLSDTGQVTPPIIGPPLNGTGGNKAIRDTDGGRWDGDRVWDRAVGPMQFIPSTWAGVRQDGNGDGIKDPNNIYDAALAAAHYLRRGGAPSNMQQAIFSYNNVQWYVDKVLDQAHQYRQAAGADTSDTAVDAAAVTAGQWVMPLKPGSYTLSSGFGWRTNPLTGRGEFHQGQDFGTGTNTPPIHAIGPGTVTRAGDFHDGFGLVVYINHGNGIVSIYAHQSRISVRPGQHVLAGQVIGYVGSTGQSTGNHLHLQIEINGKPVDPMTFLTGAGEPRGTAGVAMGDCPGLDSAASIPGQPASEQVEKVIAFAAAQIGKPYVLGAAGPDAYDCSGLVKAAWAAAGVHMEHYTVSQWQAFPRVPAGHEQRGDLVFFVGDLSTSPPPSHVGLVVDPVAKIMIEAPQSGIPVRYASYAGRDVMGFVRPS